MALKTTQIDCKLKQAKAGTMKWLKRQRNKKIRLSLFGKECDCVKRYHGYLW